MYNDSKPHSEGDIPEFLLEGSTAKDIWLYNNIFSLNKRTEYLVEKQDTQSQELEKQNKDLSEIKKKLEYTNGKIAAAIKDIETLKDENERKSGIIEDVKNIITFKKFLGSLFVNKWFLVCMGIFLVGLIRVITDSQIRELLLKIFFF